jgi:hypothetical protein
MRGSGQAATGAGLIHLRVGSTLVAGERKSACNPANGLRCGAPYPRWVRPRGNTRKTSTAVRLRVNRTRESPLVIAQQFKGRHLLGRGVSRGLGMVDGLAVQERVAVTWATLAEVVGSFIAVQRVVAIAAPNTTLSESSWLVVVGVAAECVPAV